MTQHMIVSCELGLHTARHAITGSGYTIVFMYVTSVKLQYVSMLSIKSM